MGLSDSIGEQQRTEIEILRTQFAESLREKDDMNNAIEHCKTCSERDCNTCDGILSEEWTGKGDT